MDLTYLMKTIIYIALIFIISGISHELGHCGMCLLLRCRIVEFKFWFLIIKKDEDRIKVSCCARGKDHCSFLSSSKIKMMIIMASGPAINVVYAISFLIFLILWGMNYIYVFGFAYNVLLAVHELLPSSGGDGYMIKKSLEEIRKELQ